MESEKMFIFIYLFIILKSGFQRLPVQKQGMCSVCCIVHICIFIIAFKCTWISAVKKMYYSS